MDLRVILVNMSRFVYPGFPVEEMNGTRSVFIFARRQKKVWMVLFVRNITLTKLELL